MRPQATPPRVLWDGYVNNAELVAVVTDTARACAPLLSWSPSLPRERLALLCWSFVRECTEYVPERDVQFVRTPWAFVRDAVGDCKSTAVFIGSMCRAAGLDVKLRFAQLPGDEYFGHVYPVIDSVAADPLLPFGAECVALRCLDVPL